MMTGAELGALLDADGTRIEIGTAEHIEALLIIAKIRDLNTGDVSVTIAHTSETDAVTQVGMATAATDIIRGTSDSWHRAEDDR